MKIVLDKWLLCCLFMVTVFCSCSAVTTSKIPFKKEAANDSKDIIVYIYRMHSVIGRVGSFPVKFDGELVAELLQGAYVYIHTNPGSHVLEIGVKMKIGDLTIGANPEVYIRVQGDKVVLVKKEEALPEIKQMKYDKGM